MQIASRCFERTTRGYKKRKPGRKEKKGEERKRGIARYRDTHDGPSDLQSARRSEITGHKAAAVAVVVRHQPSQVSKARMRLIGVARAAYR